jgi:hypothetical protein
MMRTLQRIQTAIAFLASAVLTGCHFEEPKPLDATPILGCYTAPDAAWLLISNVGIKVEGMTELIPYRYYFAKAGPIVEVALNGQSSKRRLFFRKSTAPFLYPVVWSEARPRIRITGSNSEIWTYKLNNPESCKP